ncbi:MAG: hypothetical protein AB2421_21045 [Thermotaleaceae bacterium]
MKRLIGEVIKNSKTVKRAHTEYAVDKEFFVALVTLCEDLTVDVPLWSFKEDIALEKKKEVEIKINQNTFLKISTELVS